MSGLLGRLRVGYASEIVHAFMVEDSESAIVSNVDSETGANNQRLWMLHDELLPADKFNRERSKRDSLAKSAQGSLEVFRCHILILSRRHSSSTHVSLLPPPCEEFTTSEPFFIATRVRPPGMIVIFSP